ncbi:MAG: ureidoglycolate lyase, partial [Beijerinckiaceae bacterium]
MRTITAEPLTAEQFAPFGHVATLPDLGGRIWCDRHMVNRRPIAAKASLSIAMIAARAERPMPLSVIERHMYSSQSFVPLDKGRYLVLVAPKNTAGAADVDGLRAFIATHDQMMTYGPDIWHGPMTPLDNPMRFAIQMFNDGTSGDEEVIRH